MCGDETTGSGDRVEALCWWRGRRCMAQLSSRVMACLCCDGCLNIHSLNGMLPHSQSRYGKGGTFDWDSSCDVPETYYHHHTPSAPSRPASGIMADNARACFDSDQRSDSIELDPQMQECSQNRKTVKQRKDKAQTNKYTSSGWGKH